MARVYYSVVASLPNKNLLQAYVEWLESGHVQAVLDGGALRASVVELDGEGEESHIRTVYEFETRADFDRYVRDHAPALRADGAARFGSGTGVKFKREIGRIRSDLRSPRPS